MVFLAELRAELGPDLAPAVPSAPMARRLTGVHVSELEDPTPYLDGGELLLTTGMPLGGGVDATSAYVGRLATKGVHALGVGLGPWSERVPEHLVQACAEAGVELLVVPDGVPFQRVSRAFWDLSTRDGRADLMDRLGTQTTLARAATRPDATAALVRGLAEALGGWAAHLPVEAGPDTFWPDRARSLVPELRAQTMRFNRAGTHSAATFELHGQAVVEYPIAIGTRTHGFLAIGSGRTLTAADRQVIVTVCTLLALKARQRELLTGTTAALGSAAAKLLLRGHAEAARMLAEDLGTGALPERTRVLALRVPPWEDAEFAARTAARLHRDPCLPAIAHLVAGCVLRYEEDGVLYLLLDAQGDSSDEDPPVADPVPDVAGALTEPLPLDEVADHVAALREAARHAVAGRLVAARGSQEARAQRWTEELAAYPRADLTGTVTAYLRHRGHWEEAARELGVHRNSLRHRISVAGSLLGVDLNDPDVAAHLWLALRRQGR